MVAHDQQIECDSIAMQLQELPLYDCRVPCRLETGPLHMKTAPRVGTRLKACVEVAARPGPLACFDCRGSLVQREMNRVTIPVPGPLRTMVPREPNTPLYLFSFECDDAAFAAILERVKRAGRP